MEKNPGPNSRREREKQQRRESIIDAGEKVFFEKGLSEATMDDVAQAAELGKGTLYLYFSGKEELLSAVYHRGMELLRKMFEEVLDSGKSGLEKLQNLGEAYVRYSMEYSRYYQLIMQFDFSSPNGDTSPNASACIKEGMQIHHLVAQVIEEGKKDKSIDTVLDSCVASLVLWGQMHGLIEAAAHQQASRKVFLKEFPNNKILQVKPEDVIENGLALILSCLTGKGGN